MAAKKRRSPGPPESTVAEQKLRPSSPPELGKPWADLVWFHAYYPYLSQGRTLEQVADAFGKDRSSVQKTIDRLENSLGVVLLRGAKPDPSELTEEAHQLFGRVQQLLDARNKLLTKGERAVVRIAAIDAAVHFWLPAVIRDSGYLNSYPNIELAIDVREWWQATSDVRKGLADFGVGTSWAKDERIQYVKLLERPHGVVVPEGHRFSRQLKGGGRGAVDVGELVSETVVFLLPHIIPFDITRVVPALRESGRLVLLTACSQVLSWVRERLGVGIMTEDMVSGRPGVEWCPLAPEDAIPKAQDAIYLPKGGLAAVTSEPARDLVLRLCAHFKADCREI